MLDNAKVMIGHDIQNGVTVGHAMGDAECQDLDVRILLGNISGGGPKLFTYNNKLLHCTKVSILRY